MTTFTVLVMLVALAFLIVLVGKIAASYIEGRVWAYDDRGANFIEAISLLSAALIIAFAVFLQGTVKNTNASSDINSPQPHSGGLICVSGRLAISGSSALYPLASAVAQDYMTKCSQRGVQATIDVKPSSSDEGLTLAELGKIQIADSDLSSKPTQGDLVDHKIAVVVFAVVVNPSVTGVQSLSQSQLKGIFNYTLTNWNQVGGPNLPIKVFPRIPSSGTRNTFQDYVLCGPETDSSNELGTNEEVVTHVKQTPGGIGYVDLGTAVSSNLITVEINGQSPLPELVAQNSYSFWSTEHMYTKGLPSAGSLTDAFIQYMTNTPTEELIAQAKSYVNFNNMLNSGLSTHSSCR